MSLYLWFASMLVISALWLIWFLYRPLKSNDIDLEQSNIALGRQKQAELEQDLDKDLIDETVYEQAKEEIAQVLAMEMTQTATVVKTQKPTPIWLTMLIVTVLSIVSVVIYQALTSHSITSQKAITAEALQAGPPPTLAESIVEIKAHLKDKSKDSQAWRMLGLALFDANKLDESLEAYERSYQLNPKNEAMLTEYASTLAKSQGNQFRGRVSTLVREALEINPNNPDALYLAGWVALNAQQIDLTQLLWKKALSILPENQADSMTLQRMLDELVQIQTPKPGLVKPGLGGESIVAPTQVVINITLSERLRQTEFANHYLMVYAKAAQGRPMPIAIQKIKLKDFTGVVTLVDENSVMPTRKLSQASKVLAVARLSKSGLAIRQAGDIEAVSAVIDVANNPIINLELK
ncbi:c-type cytochrome biogenesis protein CcmI [Bathymodiolus septemdierum thioautotrophic gill symbiont]|uniref:Cytochrome c-type biogenesis protein CcmH n=1 Tax=endosymbiont of Bathymodiolus septemdierum str. Myojin knoll TaxID=1303921 RepID=A0A0P0UQW8_9GAMM|nr:c-type cytochrome biogenesis protein CcmI [Bathymodiolus septemdierum thioautotrophic gill symbiont]BAS67408.1 cytochrome c-type biogenesis protein CcmH [endosymbiont of Bathymodiolus septemdierum str. Myojin knoll]